MSRVNKYRMIAQQVINTRGGGNVERCHGMPHSGSYSNAKHQWGCAILMQYLWPEDFGRLGIYCLVHDVPEAWIGDIPGTVTANAPGLADQLEAFETRIYSWLDLPDMAKLPPSDKAKIKACDILELWLWCLEQKMIGNEYAVEFLNEIEAVFESRRLPKEARMFVRAIEEQPTMRPRQAGVMRRLCK